MGARRLRALIVGLPPGAMVRMAPELGGGKEASQEADVEAQLLAIERMAGAEYG